MNISLSTRNKINCLAGLCEHDVWDNHCPYAKMMNKPDPNAELAKQIESLIKTEVLNNLRSLEKQTRGNTKTKRKATSTATVRSGTKTRR